MSRREDGVTLVELLITVTLIGVVVPAIAGAFIVGLTTFGDAGERVSESSSAEIAAAYWGPDVMNATSVDEDASPGCSLAAGSTPVVSFDTADGRISWFVSSNRALVRRECVGGTDTTIAAALSDTVLPDTSCAPDCAGAVILTLPQAGAADVGDFVTTLTASRRNADVIS